MTGLRSDRTDGDGLLEHATMCNECGETLFAGDSCDIAGCPHRAAPSSGNAGEPVAWRWRYKSETQWQHCSARYTPPREAIAEPLYAAPPQPAPDALREALASALVIGWGKYVRLFGEQPHGTEKQMRALLQLTPGYGAAAVEDEHAPK